MADNCPDQKCHDKVVRLITICSIAGSIISVLMVIAVLWVNLSSAESVRKTNKVDTKIEAAEKRLNEQEKQLQSYSIKADAVIERLDAYAEKWEQDKETLHKRITKVQEDVGTRQNAILKAISEIKK